MSDVNIQQYARLCLSPLFNELTYLPQTNNSIDAHSLLVLLNDIVLNNRKSIVEFGSGISTILIAHTIRKNKLNAKFYSVENNIGWYNVIKGWIQANDLEDFITLIYAPLEKMPDNQNFTTPWYKKSVLDEQLIANVFDMIVVDGPSAYKKGLELSRYPALFFVEHKLSSNYGVFIHDADRFGEMRILYIWQKRLNTTTVRFTEKLSGFVGGRTFNIHFGAK